MEFLYPFHRPQAQRLQQKASYAGFDWKNSKDVWVKINEELNELKNAEKEGNINHIEIRIKTFVFDNKSSEILRYLCRQCPTINNKKFKNRFYFIEKTLNEYGKKY